MQTLSNNRSITDVVKFIAALLVVNGHTFMYYSGMPEVSRWMNLGAQCVSLFLFFSAYGLMTAYEKRGVAYLQGFIPRRIGRILIPLITAYAVSLPIYRFFCGPIDWHNVLATLYWGGPYLKFSWYVTEIAILYLFFFGCAKFSKNARQLALALSLTVIALMGLMFIGHQPVWYINGLPCFILGIWYQQHERKIINFLECRRIPLTIGAFLGFLIFFQWRFVRDVIPVLSAYRYEYAAMFLSNIFFVVWVIFVINAINLKPNSKGRVSQSIISSFYELYLVQNAVMIVVTSFPLAFGWMWLLIMAGTLIMGIFLHQVNRSISISLSNGQYTKRFSR